MFRVWYVGVNPQECCVVHIPVHQQPTTNHLFGCVCEFLLLKTLVWVVQTLALEVRLLFADETVKTTHIAHPLATLHHSSTPGQPNPPVLYTHRRRLHTRTLNTDPPPNPPIHRFWMFQSL